MKWHYRKAYRILRQIAVEHGVSVDTVVDEINASIYQAYTQACEKGDIELIERWKRIPCSGALPGAVEFLEYMGKRMGSGG